ncbi:ATP-binding cassette transporter snq2 [Stygiomarasmius scandens]|uniref:ATP-binding cassette transporter snq2 n=1 Tax=Marasmiellus scandens TaxID=2682957 RepID=A0ABR1JVD2_9AGAR
MMAGEYPAETSIQSQPIVPESRPGSSGNTTLRNEQGDSDTIDLERLLGLAVNKLDEEHIPRREIGVVFENLRVQGLGSDSSFQPTLGEMFNPLNIIDGIRSARHPVTRDILNGFEGVVKPGEMLLVLGRPGSGCSTLLKTLANQTSEYHSVEGEVHYGPFTAGEIRQHYRGDVLYSPEDDIHFPTLTVGQTITFAARTRAPASDGGRCGLSRNDYADLLTTNLLSVFGLTHARNTLVGDAAIRGVSGGEKKRVSICEALAARARIVSWDNSTRGLDASTALEYVRALRTATDVARMTTIVSLYQAGENLYKHFDKVCVIYEGKCAYFGPAASARQYFIDMGYEPANRQTTADFLVAVTDPNGRIPRSLSEHQAPLPKTATEFAEYFRKSSFAQENRQLIQEYKEEYAGNTKAKDAYERSAQGEHVRMSRKQSAYIVSLGLQAREVMRRRLQMLRGNWLATFLNVFSYVFQAIITGTVYLKSEESTAAYFSRGGVLFFALLFSALATMAEIPSLFSQRPILLRHMQWALYHPFIDQAALFLVDLPISFFTISVFGVIIYELVQLQQTAGQIFIFLLFIFTVGLVMKGFFRALAAACTSEAVAQTFAGIVILASSMYAGYQIPKPTMIGALRWISYINPFRYGFESIMSNEFRTLNGTCASLIPSGSGYENITLDNQVCTTVGSQPGSPTVDGRTFIALSFEFSYSHTWRNFGILLGFAFAFIGACMFFTEINTRTSTETSVVQYLRKSKRVIKPKASDEEKGSAIAVIEEVSNEKPSASPKDLASDLATTDVFSWQNICYTVPVKDGERKLLNSVSGFVAPGKLTALMGESGAGKTTLLNVLAQRVSTGVVTGDKFVNGQPLPRDFQSQTGYCQQTDTHVPNQTVREALLFSAKLRQPISVPMAEKEAYVDKCLEMCGLEAFRDATVGSLNVENRKRTTIGVELAAKPKLLLFLDEPTSGLDSQSAWAIMAFLRDLADNGQAILCTIHQPSAELFQVFDRLLLLRKGGETVYFGDLGHNATTLINYFEKNGARHCQPEENPAEYMLDVIGAGATAKSIIDWYSVWSNSPQSAALQTEIERIHREGRQKPAVETALHTEFATPWIHQTWELLKRDMQSHYRNPTYLMAKFTLSIFAGLFIGFSFFKSKYSQQGTQNKLFSIFMTTIISVPLANQLQVIYINMRNIYEIRERPSRMYSWTALVTSQLLVEIPWNMLASSLFFFCWYWTVGYPSDRAGYTYLMIGVTFPLYYTSIGQAVASMSPNAEIAAILFSFVFSFVITFNGVVQPYRQLNWWKWMYRVSPYTYLIEGVLGQALGRQSIICSDLEFVTLNPPSGQSCGTYLDNYISSSGGYLTNPNATSSCQFCPSSSTDQYLASSFNIFYSHRWRDFGIFVGFIIFNIAAMFAFTFWFRIRTRSVMEMLRRRK